MLQGVSARKTAPVSVLGVGGALIALDPRWTAIAERSGKPPLRRREGGFAGLAQIIVSQQVSVASAAAIHGRLVAIGDPFDHTSVLRARLQDLESIAVPVVSFNLGVEAGQIAILLVALPVLIWIRKGRDEEATERRQKWLVRLGSLPILLLGLFWLIDRVFQLNLMPF